MSGFFKPRMEILPPAQQHLWPKLRPALELGFVLYGGTAVALRLGHRSSVDFDFFTDKPFDRVVLNSAFPFLNGATVIMDRHDSLTVLVPSGDSVHAHVKVSFFGTLGFGRVGEPDLTDDGVMQVASLDDLMATKMKVILERAEAKDYRDIAAMINAGVSLPKGLASAREMGTYGTLGFQPSESLKALVYFNDGDLHTLTKEEKNTLVRTASATRDLPSVKILSRQFATPLRLNA